MSRVLLFRCPLRILFLSHGPVALVASLVSCASGHHHGFDFFRDWIESLLTQMINFVHRVVGDRTDRWFRGWKSWNQEDVRAKLYQWLSLDFVPPAAIGAQFRQGGLPLPSSWEKEPVSVADIVEAVGYSLPLMDLSKCPVFVCKMLMAAAHSHSASAGVGLGDPVLRRCRPLLLAWFDGVALILREVEGWGRGHMGFQMHTLP